MHLSVLFVFGVFWKTFSDLTGNRRSPVLVLAKSARHVAVAVTTTLSVVSADGMRAFRVRRQRIALSRRRRAHTPRNHVRTISAQPTAAPTYLNRTHHRTARYRRWGMRIPRRVLLQPTCQPHEKRTRARTDRPRRWTSIASIRVRNGRGISHPVRTRAW